MLSNRQLSLSFNGSGHLQYMTSNSTTVAVTARMLSYQSQENTENSWDFTTNGNGGNSAVPFPGERHQHATILRGALYDEVVVEVDTQQGVSLRYRLPHDENINHVQLWITSGPFNVSPNTPPPLCALRQTKLASEATGHARREGGAGGGG